MTEDIMKFETTLPEDFNGTFMFTNWSESEFVGKWNSKEYHFPALATSPMIILEHSPLEIQHIRKKFAKDLAEREFFKGNQYEKFMGQERTAEGVAKLNGIHQAATYTLDHLKEGIQACLKPLARKKATITEAKSVDVEAKLTRNEEGTLNTVPVKNNTSLKERALQGKGTVSE